MPPHATLRERKKLRTRALIAEAAMALFSRRGFEEVTVADIAAATEVGVTTVFNYFPTKEDLFYDRQEEVVEHLSRVVGTRKPGTSFAAACRRELLELVEARDWRIGLVPSMGAFYQMVDASPALQARARLLVDRSVANLATTLARELSMAADDIVVTVAAAVLTALLTSLLDQARRASLDGTPVDVIAARLITAINRAFDLLDGEIATLGAVPPVATPALNAQRVRIGAEARQVPRSATNKSSQRRLPDG